MFTQAHPNEERRETHEEGQEERGVAGEQKLRGLLYQELLWPSPPKHSTVTGALQPSLQHPPITPPLALQAWPQRMKRKEEGGFRASLFPLFLLNFSANISGV